MSASQAIDWSSVGWLDCHLLIISGPQITKIAKVVALTRQHKFQVLAGSTGFLLPALLVGKHGNLC